MLYSRYIQLNDDEETFTKTFVNYMSGWFSASTPPAPTEAENLQSLSSLYSIQIGNRSQSTHVFYLT
jgi:hypothetical protein